MLETISKHVPLLRSLRGYDKTMLQGDATAGMTVAVMLIPQGMAYAMLAGLPPIIGLYASTLPLVVYALFGTSRQLAVGPVAMVALMVASAVGSLAEPGSSEYVAYAVLMMLLVGVIQLAMGVARLGFLVNFLSHPVVSGFTSAAALIIGFSQLGHLLGVSIPRSHHVHEVLVGAVQKLSEVHPFTVSLGLGSIVLLLALKRWNPRFPGALTVVVLGTLLVAGLGLHQRGVAIVGDVPKGLPPLGIPSLDVEVLRALGPSALAIALVGFMESVSVAKAFARKNRYEIDANRELMALGAANLAGALVQGLPVTGGFSRTAVNAQAGAKTGLASLITAAMIVVTLLLFTPLFYYLPTAVLAAIIMVAVFGLIDLAEVKHLYRVKKSDLGLLLVTFVATLGLGIEAGIGAGVAASLGVVIFRTTRPHTAELGRMPGSHVYRSIKRHPEAETFEGVLVVRVDAQFYFGNVTFLKETLQRMLDKARTPVRAVVINAATINHLDSSADSALHEIASDFREHGIELFFANVRGPVMDVMERSGLVERVGLDRFAMSVHRAVLQAREHVAGLRAVSGSRASDPEPVEEPPPLPLPSPAL